MRLYLEKKGWWSTEEVLRSVHFIGMFCFWQKRYHILCGSSFSPYQDEEFRKETAKLTIKCLKVAEAKKKPPFREMFLDVYDEMPANLKEQEQELKEFLQTYGEHYKLDGYED